MTRLLPAPLLSAAILATWLALANTVSSGHVVLGVALALALPRALGRLLPEGARPGHPVRIARLALLVLRDIVMSNIELARRILGPEAALRPRFVWMPLAIRDPHGILCLAAIITMTPGTLSAEVSDDRRWLLVHGFHVEDDAALVAAIKARYEAPLREIFE